MVLAICLGVGYYGDARHSVAGAITLWAGFIHEYSRIYNLERNELLHHSSSNIAVKIPRSSFSSSLLLKHRCHM